MNDNPLELRLPFLAYFQTKPPEDMENRFAVLKMIIPSGSLTV